MLVLSSGSRTVTVTIALMILDTSDSDIDSVDLRSKYEVRGLRQHHLSVPLANVHRYPVAAAVSPLPRNLCPPHSLG